MEPIATFPNPANDTSDGNKFRNLPLEVVHHIFSFLETIDVMRASGVSTDWRYLCTTIPHLNFELGAFRRFQSPWELSFTRVYPMYKDFINWVLMAHDKSVSIQSCRLSCLNNGNDHSVYRWIRILAQKHVLQLDLEVDSETEKPFALPRCLLASDSLEVLKINLFECDLNIPSNGGFIGLKSLILVNTRLLDQNLLRNFISNCLLLENLSLEKCLFHGFKVLEITSLNLRKFVIDCDGNGFPSYEDFTKFELKIACPNLVYFDLTGPLLQNLYWDKNPSSLQTAIICPKGDDDIAPNEELASYLLTILRGFSHVEFLELRTSILKLVHPAAVAEPQCFSIEFHNLKFLTLSMEDYHHFQSVIYLLKCSPNLQSLSLHIDESYNGSELEMPDEDITCLRCHLKMVKLIAIDTADEELELIRFFLKNGYVLEKISIMWYETTDRKDHQIRDALEKVMKFHRSSSNVEIS